MWWAPLHLAKELEGQVRDPDSLGKMERLEKRNRLSTAQTRASVLHTKVLKNIQKLIKNGHNFHQHADPGLVFRMAHKMSKVQTHCLALREFCWLLNEVSQKQNSWVFQAEIPSGAVVSPSLLASAAFVFFLTVSFVRRLIFLSPSSLISQH